MPRLFILVGLGVSPEMNLLVPRIQVYSAKSENSIAPGKITSEYLRVSGLLV